MYRRGTEVARTTQQTAAMSANEFSKLVFDISQQLKMEDVEALKYLYRVPDEPTSSLKVLRILERKGVFSSRNIQGLRELLCNVQRCDLLEMLRERKFDQHLKLCYCQAVSLAEQLQAIKIELLAFAAKQECSPTERSFCCKIADKVLKAQREMNEYVIQPLKEVTTEDGRHFGSSPGSHSVLNRSSNEGTSYSNSGLPQARSVCLSKLQPVSQDAAGNTPRAGIPHTRRNKAPHVWSSFSSKERENDYDKLGPPTPSPEDINPSTSGDIHYACTPLTEKCADVTQSTSRQVSKGRRRRKNSVSIGELQGGESKSLPSSTPTLAHKKPMNPCLSSDNLIGPSNIPVLTKKQSPKGSTQKLGDGSDDSYTGSTGDSGFCDPTVFSLSPLMHRPSQSSKDHVYTAPVKHTMNEMTAYSVPLKH